ncbi:TetR/AcrR family transcriptional regulator [Kribbella sp. NPDC056345]|uniref:TetR/AcrR family transcriptional regulator n=1 Tax=Kribbella sp. NPDC056345 TaxID=3345789 RepID=UPI0035D70204
MASEEYPSVWTRPKRNRRREQPVLSQEQIVAAAIKLLDANGIEALTMRKLGAELGAVATAVYWHVANKDELIELVVDHVYGEIDVPEISSPDEWRAAVTAFAQNFRNMILRHPWLGSTLADVGVTLLGPNMLASSDRTLGLYQAAGFGLREANHASTTVLSHVVGLAATEAATISKMKRSGLSEQEWMAKVWPAAEQAAEPYPRLKALYAEYTSSSAADNGDEVFEYGLACVLDGLEARLSRR